MDIGIGCNSKLLLSGLFKFILIVEFVEFNVVVFLRYVGVFGVSWSWLIGDFVI